MPVRRIKTTKKPEQSKRQSQSKRQKALSKKDKDKENDLKERQEKFCQLFTRGERGFFGNGVQCYLQIYDIDREKTHWYDTACAAASQLLSNIKVCRRISELLESDGFNNNNVDRQHLYLINQHADLKTKMSAIKEYNQLKSRVKNKLEVTHKSFKQMLTDMEDDEEDEDEE